MNFFERLYKDGVSQEKYVPIERDDEKLHVKFSDKVAEMVYRPISDNPDILDEFTVLGKKYKLAKELCKDNFTSKDANEKVKSKTLKRKPKKVSTRANKTAVEIVQKKF